MEDNNKIINFMDFFKNEEKPKLETDFKKEDFEHFFIEEEVQEEPETETKFVEKKLEKLETIEKKVDTIKQEVNHLLEEVEEEIIEEEIEEPISNDEDFYPVFLDKPELFTCQVSIDGADINKTEARLVIESDDWTIMFNGDIKRNGQCEINMKKLSILKEGAIGKIRLEIIAEGSLFIPWEEDFKAKLSKKVSVSLNENRNIKKSQPKNTTPSVKVNIKR